MGDKQDQICHYIVFGFNFKAIGKLPDACQGFGVE